VRRKFGGVAVGKDKVVMDDQGGSWIVTARRMGKTEFIRR
jgi:hypothetical protein